MTRASACWKAAISIVNSTMTEPTRKAATKATWLRSQLTMIWTRKRMKDCLWISRSASHTLHRRPCLRTLHRYRVNSSPSVFFLLIIIDWRRLQGEKDDFDPFADRRRPTIAEKEDEYRQKRRRLVISPDRADPFADGLYPFRLISLVLLIVLKSLWWLKTTLRRESFHECSRQIMKLQSVVLPRRTFPLQNWKLCECCVYLMISSIYITFV